MTSLQKEEKLGVESFIENLLEQEKKRINCQKVPEKVVLNGVEYKPVNK
mgnify:CR=1 FL=1